MWDDLLAGEELAYLTTEPPRAARSVPLPKELHPAVHAALARQGIHELYAHQAEAWAASRAGEHVIVTTGTASGKTLAFNLPVLDALATDPNFGQFTGQQTGPRSIELSLRLMF